MTPRDPRLDAFRGAEALVRGVAQATLPEVATTLLFRVKTASTYHERMELSTLQKKVVEGQEAFAATFGPYLHEAIAEDLAAGDAPDAGPGRARTDWQSLGLVDEGRIQDDILQKRIGQLVSHACEAELRALDGYAGALLGIAWADEKRNPLRGDVVGRAVMRAVERLSDVPAERKLLAREFGQSLAEKMPACYRQVIEGFQADGVQPVSLALRPVDDVPQRNDWESSWIGTRPPVAPQRLQDFEKSLGGRLRADPPDTGPRGLDTLSALFDRLMNAGGGAVLPPPSGSAARSGSQDAAEQQLTDLMRRLHVGAATSGLFETPPGAGAPRAAAADEGPASELAGLMAVNLIRAHQDQLERVAKTRHDHLVIEVVGSLFDQILSDPKVAPQLARHIARLQLPVLRVALADARFFSARQHPVRRFVNRVATLGCAFDGFEEGPGRDLLVRIGSLVDEIVEGDFERIETYDAKLDALQAFVDAESRRQVEASSAAPVLREKEAEWRVQRRFARALAESLEPLALPAFVRDFLVGVWTQVIVLASRREGVGSDAERTARRVAVELVASVQPKRSIEDRKRFLSALPPLMNGLNAGMARVAWPQASREAFLGELMTVHAGSLKAPPLSELDHNMRMRHAEAALRQPLPEAGEGEADPGAPAAPGTAADAPLALGPAATPGTPAVEPNFSPDEERALGLVSERSVDWSSAVHDAAALPAPAADASAQPAADGTTDADGSGLPTIDLDALDRPARAEQAAAPATAPAPNAASLRDHLELGSAYELNLKGRWEKVRLTYMSPSRTLFLFAHGAKDRETVSMTSRLLGRLCDAGRMRAFETASLVERSTERARLQLAAQPPRVAAA
jgi:hypothetical protein